ncbi:hypothetical protein KIPB_013246, partial [Kipferlia bialata]
LDGVSGYSSSKPPAKKDLPPMASASPDRGSGNSGSPSPGLMHSQGMEVPVINRNYRAPNPLKGKGQSKRRH